MDNNYSSEYETDEKKKFQITRGMVILASVILVVIVIVIIIIVNAINSKKPEYTTADFNRLESRMEEEAMTYLSQKGIELTSEEVKIDLKDLLSENGGSIDSSKVKAAKICEGYVLASKVETESYKPYIKCKNLYTTNGYVSNDKKTTTKKVTTKKDTEKPVITIIGEKEITINQGSDYVDQGAKATDNIDGDITSKIKIENKVDISESGSYTVTYTVSDKAGNVAEKTRKVNVVSAPTTTVKPTTTKKQGGIVTTTKPRVTTTQKITTPPTITLRGRSYINDLKVGDKYIDDGYYATDAKGNDLTARVVITGSVNMSQAGTYRLVYSVTDDYGNKASQTRTIVVKPSDKLISSISLTPNTKDIKVGESYTLIVIINPSDATNKNLIWSSSNNAVATVSNGVVKGIGKGTAKITARSSNGVSKTVDVIVK